MACSIAQSEQANFNPRSPCGERLFNDCITLRIILFQSTLPVWGATALMLPPRGCIVISIHAPRVGSDVGLCFPDPPIRHFNPRSPCGERHPSFGMFILRHTIFQSTLPVWGATDGLGALTPEGGISIHAPRVGSDFIWPSSWGTSPISIHAPRVGSDQFVAPEMGCWIISIHAPRVGSDPAYIVCPLT